MDQLGLSILEVDAKSEGVWLLDRHGADTSCLLGDCNPAVQREHPSTISATRVMLWMHQKPAIPFVQLDLDRQSEDCNKVERL